MELAALVLEISNFESLVNGGLFHLGHLNVAARPSISFGVVVPQVALL